MESPGNEEERSASNPTNLSHIAASEFNIEIGIRERVTEAIKARIAWASLLRESLETEIQSPSIAPVSYKYAALDALKISDRPTDFFIDREEQAPPNLRLQDALHHARPAPRSKNQIPRNSKTTFLFIRSGGLSTGRNAFSDSETLILKCPVCSRTTFTSLQGLLNHARISHTLEWGTHEECIRACATTDPDLDIQDGLEVGYGASGILPGLRTIFEMAVGPSHRENAPADSTRSLGDMETDLPVPNHLTKTLGLHEDTPALAPFLGKEPIRRGIKVHHQDAPVDISTSSPNTAMRTVRAGVRFAQRGQVEKAREEDVAEAEKLLPSFWEDYPQDKSTLNHPSSHLFQGAGTTRFHFMARIIVTDRSLSIESDTGTPFSHKWMLSVDAPSYSHNITTILRSMSVTPLSSLEAVRCSKPETDQPPFIVVGLASEPFLARINLVFNGIEASDTSEGQPFSLEHWVDLDPLRCSTAVIGDEQIRDVELDKRTHIGLPSEPLPTNYKSFWKLAEDSSSSDSPAKELNIRQSQALAFQEVLKDLLPRFPLTLQGLIPTDRHRISSNTPLDVKRKRGMKPVPYRLVASESHFLSLVEGRRKAIEWGRIRALRDAYNEIAKDQASSLSPLTAADVYSWMQAEGHLRPQSKPLASTAMVETPKELDDGELGPRWCALCGLERSLHSLVLAQQIKREDTLFQEERAASIDSSCWIAAQHGSTVKLRPIDVKRAQPSTSLTSVQHSIKDGLDPSLIVQLTDPRLTLEVRRVIHLLHLPFFKTPSERGSSFPLDQLGQTPREVESTLAPYSLLTMCLRPFIRNIILSGLDVAKRQKGFAISQAPPKKANKKDSQGQKQSVSLLTPAHILTGIRNHGRSGDRTDEAVLLCLSGLGTALESLQEERNTVFEKPVVVKVEQP